MCNLFANVTPQDRMRQFFNVDYEHDRLGNAEPQPAIFPKTSAPMVTVGQDGKRQLENAHWGFVLPQKSKRTGDPIQPKAVNNARDDKLQTSYFWKPSFEKRRCLIPASSFCEAKGRNPATYYWFGLRGDDMRPPFAFAGIWTYFDGMYGTEPRQTLTSSIVTTKPNELVRDIHPDRMPVILDLENYETWLTGTANDAFKLITPYPADKMTVFQSGEGLKSDHGVVV